MYGTPGCLLSGPSCHNGMPARACPTTLALFASRAFVARSDDVIPPLSKTRESAKLGCKMVRSLLARH